MIGTAGLAAPGGVGGAGGSDARDPAPGLTLNQLVDPADLTMEAVASLGNIPVFTALTGYASDESSAAQAAEQPLYAPYESGDPAWWDNLVAEQAQARITRVMFPTRGAFTLDASDTRGPGNMNPRRLAAWVEAVQRAGAGNLFTAGCFVDTAFFQTLSNTYHSRAVSAPVDLSQQDEWNDIFWLRGIKPWFDTIPASFWWRIDDNTPGGDSSSPVIQFGALSRSSFQNLGGNTSQLLTFVATRFESTYGKAPVFVLDASWFSADPALVKLASVVGKSPAFDPPAHASAFTTYGNLSFGSVVAGFAAASAPGTEQSTQSLLSIPRSSPASDGETVATLLTGLAQAAKNHPRVLLQDFTDYAHSAGLYRSEAEGWDYPNQYLNLIRRYADPRTVTTRLEAEACDHFSDTTPGNSGGAFRRQGDLDVRALSDGGWGVTNTAPGEWIEFEGLDFSPGSYEISVSYATPGASVPGSAGPRLRLVVDGGALPTALLPNTGGGDAFQAALLGMRSLSYGTHTLRIELLDGLVDLDWLFVKKIDPIVSLRAAGKWVTAVSGGNGRLYATQDNAAVYETFTLDDLDGGGLLDGDRVNIQAYDGLYLTVSSLTFSLNATQRVPANAESFVVHRLSGSGPISVGQTVAFQTADLAHYLSVNVDGMLDATGTSVGTSQSFDIGPKP